MTVARTAADVTAEKGALDARLHELYALINADGFNELPAVERYYLRQQSEYMEQYSEVLLSRLELFD